MHVRTQDEIRDEVVANELPLGMSAVVSIDRLMARIARRPGLWRSRMRTRHKRDEEHLSPLPSAA